MKRQKIRKAFIFISFLLFPVTIYYLSPYLVYMAGLEGRISGSMVLFGLMFLSALFFGRLFCAWMCPAAGLQEACFSMRDKKVVKGDWIKWMIWIPWLLGLIAVFSSSHSTPQLDFFYQTEYGISVHRPEAYIVFYAVTFLILGLALGYGRRSFCHHLCWMSPFMITGRKFRNIFKWPSLKLEGQTNKCINCLTCTKNCPMSLDVNKMVHAESMEKPECILCGTCIDNCTSKAIHYKFKAGK